MPVEWREGKYRRWGTSEVPAFASPDGASALAVPTWLQASVRTLHASQQSGLLTLLAARGGEVAFAQRLMEAAQDGTGRSDFATHIRWCVEPPGPACSNRLCRTLLAWLLRDPEMLARDADPRGLFEACATAGALERLGRDALVAALDLLVRRAAGEPARLALPGAEDLTARQALVRRVRAALVLAGDTLDLTLVAGFERAPALDPPLLAWLGPGAEAAPHADALRLAERVKGEWKRPLAALAAEVARQSDKPSLVALARALDLQSILGVAVHEDGALWRFDARAAQSALSRLPEAARAALQGGVRERLRDELRARAGAWTFTPDAGLLLTAVDGRRQALLAVPAARAEMLAALQEHERWSGTFDEAQCAALVASGPLDVALHYAPRDLLAWSAARLLEAAQHQPGAIAARWSAHTPPERRRATARHVTAAVTRDRDVLPLGLLAQAEALPASEPRLRELVALLGADDAALTSSPAEIDAAWHLARAAQVLARCPDGARTGWLRFFGEQAAALGDGAVALAPELAQQMYEALPAAAREAALAGLLRCAHAAPALRAAALVAFLRAGPARARWEPSLPEPSADLLLQALRAQSQPGPPQEAPADELRVRFWRYVALRLTSSDFTPEAQARALIRTTDDVGTWRLLGDWLARGRDELLFDLWLYGPTGALRDVDPVTGEQALDLERLMQAAVARDVLPQDNGLAWEPARSVVQRFRAGRAWAAAMRSRPRETLRRAAESEADFATARDLGWELYLRGQSPSAWAPAVWRAMPEERALRQTLLRSLPWPAQVPLIDASQGQFSLADALAATE